MADSFTYEHGRALSADWEFDLGRNIKVTGIDEFKLKMHNMVPEVRAALEQAIGTDAIRMRDQARALASGPVVKEKTGSFVNSIVSSLRSSETGVFGTVSSADPRDPLFEYGGTTSPRDILPNAAQALRFLGGSALMHVISLGTVGMVYAAIVHRPAIDYQPHPIIHAAFDQMEATVEHDIEAAAHQAIYRAE